MLGQTLGRSGQVQPRYLDFLHSLCSHDDSAHQWGTSMPLGSLESNWVIWKASLSLLSWVSIFNLEEKKKLQLSYLAVLKFMGQRGFQVAAPAGHCSDDERLRHVTSVAGLWWCIAATSHSSYITASTAAPVRASPVHSGREPWLRTSLCSCCTPHDHHIYHVFLTVSGREER